MGWKLENDRPIYLQLAEQIEEQIITGIYKPGDRLPSVRDLAADAAVNPNTMQKALAELESRELIFAQRTSGRFITDDAGALADRKRKRASELTKRYLIGMKALGYDRAAAAGMVQAMPEDAPAGAVLPGTAAKPAAGKDTTASTGGNGKEGTDI